MKPEMSFEDAKNALKTTIAKYKVAASKPFSGTREEGLERATNLVNLINKAQETDALSLVQMIASNPNYIKAKKLKTQLTDTMLQVLGVEEKDLVKKAQELAEGTDDSEKQYIPRAKEVFLNQKIKSREPVEKGMIEMDFIKKP